MKQNTNQGETTVNDHEEEEGKKIHVGLHGKMKKQTLADVGGGVVGELAGESSFRKAKQVC